MKVYADTNFFTNIWADLTNSNEASELLRLLQSYGEPLPVTRLLRMEFSNALQRLVYETRHGTQLIRVSPEAALVAKGMFDDMLYDGTELQWQVLPEDQLEACYDTLVYRHTAKLGFRTYDMLHVASALLMGCDVFWSFDKKAKQLARLEGLITNEI